MGRRCTGTEPYRVAGYAVRTYSGHPSSSIRFSTSAAMAMCGRPPRCKEKMEDRLLLPGLDPLSQTGDPLLGFGFFDQTLGITIDEPRDVAAQLRTRPLII